MAQHVASALDGRTIRLKLDVTVRPPSGVEPGCTDAAFEVGRKIAFEACLLAQRLAGDGCTVRVERRISVC